MELVRLELIITVANIRTMCVWTICGGCKPGDIVG